MILNGLWTKWAFTLQGMFSHFVSKQSALTGNNNHEIALEKRTQIFTHLHSFPGLHLLLALLTLLSLSNHFQIALSFLLRGPWPQSIPFESHVNGVLKFLRRNQLFCRRGTDRKWNSIENLIRFPIYSLSFHNEKAFFFFVRPKVSKPSVMSATFQNKCKKPEPQQIHSANIRLGVVSNNALVNSIS